MTDKKRTDADWDDLRVFAALARYGSLSATARALRVNHATVARRIAALEQTLGHSLFERRADGYALSDHGLAILEDARRMEALAVGIRDRLVAPGSLTGRVRLTTTRSLADLVLSPHLAEVMAACPGIQLEVITDIRVQSLAQREADIALRLGRPKDSDLTGRHVATLRYGFYAHADLCLAFGRGNPVSLIGYDLDSDGVAEAAWLETHFADRPVALRSGSNMVQANAAAAGLGVAMLPLYLARLTPGLHPLAYGRPLPDRELWMLTPPALMNVPRVRAVWDGFSTFFARHNDLF